MTAASTPCLESWLNESSLTPASPDQRRCNDGATQQGHRRPRERVLGGLHMNTTTPDHPQQPDTWVEPTSPLEPADDEAGPIPPEGPVVAKTRPWWVTPAIAAAAGALVVGVILGIYAEGKMQAWKSHSDAIAAQRDEARAERDDLQGRLDRVTEERNSARAANNSVAARATVAEQRAAGAEDALAAELLKIEEREASVAIREKAVTTTEQRVADTTITEGTWTVGRDIEAGTYLTQDTVSGRCYWGIYRSGTNGGDIIENDIVTGGRPTVTLKAGQDFTTTRCGSWIKQG